MNSKVEPYSLRNKLKKIGPGHFIVIQPPKKRINDSVPEKDQDPTKRYCSCGRKLNKTNTSGTCAVCLRKLRFRTMAR